jgi:hypothetical protein
VAGAGMEGVGKITEQHPVRQRVNMQYIGIAISIIFALGMIAIYGAAALHMLSFLASKAFSKTGIVIIGIILFILCIYCIAKDIQTSGIKNFFYSFFTGQKKLYLVFWIYFFFIGAMIRMLFGVLLVDFQEFEYAITITYFIYAILIAISLLIHSIKAKSFILWKGLTLIIASLNLFYYSGYIYLSYKDDISVRYFVRPLLVDDDHQEGTQDKKKQFPDLEMSRKILEIIKS